MGRLDSGPVDSGFLIPQVFAVSGLSVKSMNLIVTLGHDCSCMITPMILRFFLLFPGFTLFFWFVPWFYTRFFCFSRFWKAIRAAGKPQEVEMDEGPLAPAEEDESGRKRRVKSLGLLKQQIIGVVSSNS